MPKKDILIKFGNKIRQERLKQNLSQEAFADKIGIHRTYIGMIERAEKNISPEQAKKWEKKVRTAGFDLEDFMDQIRQVRKMGSLGQLIETLGFSKLTPYLSGDEGEKRLKKVEAIILSMTYEERHNPTIIDGSRRRRIARGSGTAPQDVNQLLNQFYEMRKLTKSLTRGKLPKNIMNMLAGGWHQSK